jgi:hypothetical protein
MARLFAVALVALLSLAAFLASPPSCTSQQGPSQTPTFRTETQLVEVDTVATDSHGKAVTGLRADEFRARSLTFLLKE